jgi:hypothetical protein
MEYSSYETPTALYVGMTHATLGCKYDGERLIVRRVTDAGKVFLNQEQEDWNSLAGILSEIYSPRLHRTLILAYPCLLTMGFLFSAAGAEN